MTVLASRAHWARTFLSKAGLLASPRRNVHEITDMGRALLAECPERIDNAVLERFDSFRAWRLASRTSISVGDVEDLSPSPPRSSEPASATPEERMATAHAELEAALRSELLEQLTQMDPIRFERLILDLLKAMGYGAGALARHLTTKATGDGGIDGIIHEDALGLDAVYIQAKRYSPDLKVGRPAIQQFIGSLTGEGATKGVFVTTSGFSREAREFLLRVQHRVVLIDGDNLAGLMIRHGVGVRDREVYTIRSLDEDAFADPQG
jgi:restriction system protein